jgi:hypothetical protein
LPKCPRLKSKLVKELGYERIECACGMAVLSKDPTPEITATVKKIAIEEGAKFSIIDTSIHPEIIKKYNIRELHAVIIGKNTYSIDGKYPSLSDKEGEGMTEDDELAQIRKKKLEELMRRKQEILAPKPPAAIEVFTSPT